MDRFVKYLFAAAFAFAIIFGGYLYYKVHVWGPPHKKELENTTYAESDLEFCTNGNKVAFARVKPGHRPPNWEYFYGGHDYYMLALQKEDGKWIVLDVIMRRSE